MKNRIVSLIAVTMLSLSVYGQRYTTPVRDRYIADEEDDYSYREEREPRQAGSFTLSSSFLGNAPGLAINVTPETNSQYASTQVSFSTEAGWYVVRNLAFKAGLYLYVSKYGSSDPVTTTAVSLGVKYHFVGGFYGECSGYNYKSGSKSAATYGQMILGYDIYVTKHFFLEPAAYYRFGLDDSSSKFGVLFGFGVAF